MVPVAEKTREFPAGISLSVKTLHFEVGHDITAPEDNLV